MLRVECGATIFVTFGNSCLVGGMCMSSEGSTPTVQTGELASRLDAIDRQQASLSEAIVRAGKVRRRLLLAILVFLVFFGFLFYKAAMGLVSEENLATLEKAGQESISANLGDVQREIQHLVDYASPKLKDAAVKQVEKDSKKYVEALNEQRKVLVENLQQRVEERLEEHYASLLREHQQILKEEFPDLDDEKYALMMDNFQKALKALVQKYYAAEFERQFKIMNEAWDEFPVADFPAEGEPDLSKQIFANLLELLRIKLSQREASLDVEDEADIKIGDNMKIKS